MNFGNAIEVLKAGGCVTRHGWNGKHMYLFLKKGSYPSGAQPSHISGVSTTLFDLGDKGTGVRMPTICMKTADDTIVEGWLASQTDILSDDWAEVRFAEEAPAPKVGRIVSQENGIMHVQVDSFEELLMFLETQFGAEAADRIIDKMAADGMIDDMLDDEDEDDDEQEDDDLPPCNCRICKGHWLN